MMNKPDLNDALNEALRKIGRNVVNFQKMEAMLKHLIACGNIQGYASDLTRVIGDRLNFFAKRPMGQLTDEFVSTFSKSARPAEGPEDLAEAWLSCSFEIESGEDFAKERKTALKAIVEERNKLIHQMLAHFDTGSLESCVTLSAELDEQHTKLIPEFALLESMVRALNEAQHELVGFFQSEDW